jgi:hypothetical protein
MDSAYVPKKLYVTKVKLQRLRWLAAMSSPILKKLGGVASEHIFCNRQ